MISPGQQTQLNVSANPTSLFVLDPLRDDRWRQLVSRHPAASVFHTPEWLRSLRSAYGYEPVVYTNCGPSAELTSGVAFCKVKSWLTGRRVVSLPFSDHCEPLVDSSEELDGVLLGVRKILDQEQWRYCELRPLRCEPGTSTSFGQSDRYLWHVIDLRPSLEAVFGNLHGSTRRKIRRAEREGLRYEEGNSEQLLAQFYRLVVVTRRRQSLPPQPIRWFRSLIANLGSNLTIRVASSKGIPIASILTLSHKRTVTYKYGCSDARMHPLGGMSLLLWNTIQQAKDAGHEALDLGRSDIDNEGLAYFKENWGGVRADLRYWRYPSPSQTHRGFVKPKIMGRIVEAAPEWMLTAAGNLLYRHIG